MRRAAFALAVTLAWAPGADATPSCLERCQKERGLRRRALDECLAGAAREAPDSRAKNRLECRRRSVIPSCDGLPPCADGAAATVGIDFVARYFSRTEDGDPLEEAVYHPGETLHFRYQALLMPDQAGSEVALEGDVTLKQDDRVIETRAKSLHITRRLSGDEAEQPMKFGGRASFVLPKKLAPGEYIVEVALRENRSGVFAARGYRFTVGPASSVAAPTPSR